MTNEMLKKIIHYCWFGANPFPEIVKKCIASWKKFCPDYEIIEWNESNFDIHCCKYVEQAYEAKKWAFVSDYCRFFVLYNYGGIYLDTDVELIKSLNGLPQNFVGFENKSTVASGLIRGATIGDDVCGKMLNSYNNDAFVLDNGKLNLKTVCERETSILGQYGLKLDGTKQVVLNTTVFPTEYFCPYNYITGKTDITENTYSIHHYSYSWKTDKTSFHSKIYKILYKIFGERFANNIRKIFGRKR